MAASGLSNTSQTAYQLPKMGYATYGVEYEPGADGYVTWYQNGQPAWSVYPSAVGRYFRSLCLLPVCNPSRFFKVLIRVRI